MMCIRSLRALEAHEEVFVDYNYRVWQAPAWYQEQWIQYKRDTENVSEVNNTTLPKNENKDMADRILSRIAKYITEIHAG